MRSEILSTPRAWQTFLANLGYDWDDLNLKHIYESWSLPPRISQHYARQIDWTNPNDPLYLQIVPNLKEREIKDYEQPDPIGDHEHEITPGLIHRYPNRVLLWPHLACSIHCRFCFRREDVGGVQPSVNWEIVSSYLQKHPEVEEVILSGGDPAMLTETQLSRVVDRLTEIKHLKTLRIHSRALAADPDAITDNKISTLTTFKEGNPKRKIVWVHHVNHARELTVEGEFLSERLQASGVRELSQSVLLKDVNDSASTLKQLFTKLDEQGIKPYYLHHLDPAQGIDHFRVSIPKGLEIYRELRGDVSGYVLPTYMLELPDGQGKVPVEQLRAVTDQVGVYEVTSPVSKMLTQYRDHAVTSPTR